MTAEPTDRAARLEAIRARLIDFEQTASVVQRLADDYLLQLPTVHVVRVAQDSRWLLAEIERLEAALEIIEALDGATAIHGDGRRVEIKDAAQRIARAALAHEDGGA